MRSPVERVLDRVHHEARANRDGAVADYIPELTRADPDLFGLALSTLDGAVYAAGDADIPFTIQSVSKPFVMALAIEDSGLDALLSTVGVEPTGDPFNAVTLEPGTGRPLNPMVNAGAIVTSTLVAGADRDARSQRILSGLSDFAGRDLVVDDSVLASELATADRNRAIAFLMRSMGSLAAPVEETLEVYFGQCSILVTAKDLAVMAATLANGGRNPITGKVVVQPDVVMYVLSVMITCGLYDFSGEWMFRTGLPAKSGVAGGVTVVLPGEFGIGCYGPRLDAQGNSVRGVVACEGLSREFGLHVMRPRPQAAPPIHRRLHHGQVRSRRARPARERAVLTDAAQAIVVYELQGDLTFKEAELISRKAAAESARWLIFDAARVNRVDRVASGLLDATASALADRDVSVLRSGPWGTASLVPEDRSFASAADAVEFCENALVAEAGSPDRHSDEVPLSENDLCRSLAADDIATLHAYGVPLSFTAGQEISQGEAVKDSLLLITRGLIEMLQIDQSAAAADSRNPLTSRSAGTAVGLLATLHSAAVPTRLVAATDVSVVAFGRDALDLLHTEHPRVAANLYHAALQAVAAEYRWMAAENVALAR
jgi:glutaminase